MIVSKRALRVFQTTVVTVALIGCSDGERDKRANLTQREKDSILAGSLIPGARAVKTSMTSADSATARQLRLDSADREP
jgi:hypothetical protein